MFPRFASILLFTLCTAFAVAQPADFPWAPALVTGADRAALAEIASLGTDIDAVTADGVRVYVTQAEFDALAARGHAIHWIPDEATESWYRITAEAEKTGADKLAYHSYAEMTAQLQAYAAQYPSICSLTSIGKSVQNRDLWVLTISDNPGVPEDEPGFKYISSIHGNEIVGMEVMLDLIQRLLEGYGTDARLTTLVDETEIHILPLMNPDGWEASPASRYNANNVDMNRSFPSWSCGEADSTVGREPEIAAVMNWDATFQATLSANFHGGAMVANYPYDECGLCADYTCNESLTDDDDVLRAVSKAYSLAHGRMATSGGFTDGITNGVAWYALYGGMQDWNFIWRGCMEITIELDAEKIPSTSRLPSLISENREPTLAFMEWVHRGVRGIVTDAATGTPIKATVRVQGRDFDTYTDLPVGDYHRILPPGTYTLEVTADGYVPATLPDIVVTDGSATRADVALQSTASVSGSGWKVY
ncbi:MAG: hypothetical protein PWP23_2305 [Candidatus Sumerlaeota bacterium]|nr:hypothetical protein [Candidatus Sumerlaeota bacterium]